MGCGGAYGHKRPSPSNSEPVTPSPSYSQDSISTMICDMCSVRFTLMNRKVNKNHTMKIKLFSFNVFNFQKICSECKNYFCSGCLPRESGKRYGDRVCGRCRELGKVPPLRTELMKLRVKDLQNYLIRKRVNTKSCVGQLTTYSSVGVPPSVLNACYVYITLET